MCFLLPAAYSVVSFLIFQSSNAEIFCSFVLAKVWLLEAKVSFFKNPCRIWVFPDRVVPLHGLPFLPFLVASAFTTELPDMKISICFLLDCYGNSPPLRLSMCECYSAITHHLNFKHLAESQSIHWNTHTKPRKKKKRSHLVGGQGGGLGS